MTRLGDEIDTLVEATSDGRLHSFEPVRAKRRQLVRRRYTKAAGATLVIAAVVGLQLHNGDPSHKATPATPSPKAPVFQVDGLPPLAGTVWRLNTVANGPGAEAQGGVQLDADLYAEFRFSSDTDGVLLIGDATSPVHLRAGQAEGTVSLTLGNQSPVGVSDDVSAVEDAVTAVVATDLKAEPQNGAEVRLVSTDGQLMSLTRLETIGLLGHPGDQPWSVRGVSGPSGPVTVDPSLNARFRLENADQGEFAVGANSALATVSGPTAQPQLNPLLFTDKPAKPGELAVTKAIEALSKQVSAQLTGHTLVLTYASGGTLTLVSTG